MEITDIYPFQEIDPNLYTIYVKESWYVCEKDTFKNIKSLLSYFPCVIITSKNEDVFDIRYIDGILGAFYPQMFREPIEFKLKDTWQSVINNYQTRFVISTVGEESYAVAKRDKNALPPHTDGLEYCYTEKFLSILHLHRPKSPQGINYVVDMSYIAHLMAEKYEEEFDALCDPKRTKFLIQFTGETQKHPVFSFSEKDFLEVYYHDPSWIKMPPNDHVVSSGMMRIKELSYRDNLRIPISLEPNSVAIIKNSHLHGRQAFPVGERLTVFTQHLGLPTVRVFNKETKQREEAEGISPGIIPVLGSTLEQKYLKNSKKSCSLSLNEKTILYSTQSCNL
ncbi:MAG: TauD/TfdA family dioxygenase [Nostoc sp. NOS(2021)]|uniref:TauD/TfdA family dioxygenase n=1 Tax=Nostoc sp. NOS(2021) TaxID=2815407 RepID=UPI0025D0FA42|nr:TauD/TfdA family dioxygenase [Nostoc sp. NOS(2021)]MBN3896655.1 TauD/TfdA family dioxygenase [Nostoc sp. NOS(2021)]